MIISVLVLLILIWNFYIGYARGMVLQGFYTVGSLLSLVIASHYYQALASKVTLWIPYSNPTEGASMSFFTSVDIFELDKVYYAGIVFLALYSVAYLAFRLLGVLVHLAPINRFDKPIPNVVSGALSVLVTSLFLSMIFTVLATIPMDFVQNLLASSGFVKLLVNHMPIFSNFLEHVWVTAIL